MLQHAIKVSLKFATVTSDLRQLQTCSWVWVRCVVTHTDLLDVPGDPEEVHHLLDFHGILDE